MSEWTPKVGDKVMVGECGPYDVVGSRADGDYAVLDCADDNGRPDRRLGYSGPWRWAR